MQFLEGGKEAGLYPNDALMRLEFASWHLLSQGEWDRVWGRRQLKSGIWRNRKLAQD